MISGALTEYIPAGFSHTNRQETEYIPAGCSHTDRQELEESIVREEQRF